MTGTLAGLLLTAALLALGLGLRRLRPERGPTAPARRRLVGSQGVRSGEAAGVATELAAALRAGRSVAQAVERAADATPGPLGRELGRTSAEISLGEPVGAALDGLASRSGSAEVRTLVAAVTLQHRSGGDLARTIEELAGRIRESQRLTSELRAATAQAKMTVWLVAGLPVAAALLMEVVATGLVHRTISHPAGRGVVMASLTLQTLGVAIVWRILRGIR